MESNCTKHEIVIGKINSGQIEKPLLTGHAFLNAGDDFYTVKLFMFPGQTYYLVKNREAKRYTVFAKHIRDERGTRFQNPVGLAQLMEGVLCIEIYFPVLRSQMYLSLFPSAS
ncbi:hypothetical protein BH10BDE1_BH10BDE1_28100 [soil metagenome]